MWLMLPASASRDFRLTRAGCGCRLESGKLAAPPTFARFDQQNLRKKTNFVSFVSRIFRNSESPGTVPSGQIQTSVFRPCFIRGQITSAQKRSPRYNEPPRACMRETRLHVASRRYSGVTSGMSFSDPQASRQAGISPVLKVLPEKGSALTTNPHESRNRKISERFF